MYKNSLKKKPKYAESDINDFQRVIEITDNILEGIDTSDFLSPYSLVPIISQILGLNTPLMGSGDSPYSIISFASQLDTPSKSSLLKEAFKIPLMEKRRIVDEISDMIAPTLLEEEDKYIELCLNAKYEQALEDVTQPYIGKLKLLLRRKFSTLAPFILRFNGRDGDFAHIAHYGYVEDLHRECRFLQDLAPSVREVWFDYSYPIVNELVIKGFKVKGSKVIRDLKGWIIFVANSTSQLMQNGRLRSRKILQAAALADKLGAKIVSMGGLIASFAKGGYYLSEHIHGVGFTTGHAYTIANIIDILQKCCDKVNLNVQDSTVAIVGAAGSIGSGCAQLLAEINVKNMILIDTTVFISRSKLEELQQKLMLIKGDIKISLSNKLDDMRKADVIIIATNSPFSLIKEEYLRPGAIVIDDSFPKNISEEILNMRDDVIFLEGGGVQLPLTIDIDVARNMPDLLDAPMTRLISCKEVYGCFAESLILSLFNHRGNYGLGHSDTILAKDIAVKARMVGISSAPLQCFDKAVEERRFKKVAQILAASQGHFN